MNRSLPKSETPADPHAALRLELERCRHELEAARLRVADLEQVEALLAGENRILEMAARGNPLPEILDALCRLIEDLSKGSLCGILLVDLAGSRVEHGAAPSLPRSYNEAIHGRLVRPDAGPCGLAAQSKEQVIVADIATDRRWETHEWRTLALDHGLRACWSTPITSPAGDALGTFAIYWREPRSPTPRDQRLIAQTTHLAAVAIEREREARMLRRSELYLAEAQRLSLTGSFGWRVDTGELFWSAETYCILGYDSAVPPSLDLVLNRTHPADTELVRRTLDRAAQDGTDLDFEHRLRMPDGTIKHLHVVARANRSESGLFEFVGAVMDITERKNSQDAVRAAKARFEGILEIAEDAIISIDAQQRVVLFNQGAESVFGYAAEEVVGRSLDLLLPVRFVEAHRRHIQEFGRSPEVSRSMAQRREVFGRRKDASEFPAEASISKLELGDEVVFTVILRDITERQRLEKRLRESERNLAEGQRLTKTGSWVLDFKTGNTDWSVETCRIFGFPDPPPSPHYSEFRARVRPEDRESVDRGLRESFETGEPRPLDYIFILPDGTSKNIETISQPVRDETGVVVRLMGTVMDVSERKKGEATLRAAELLARGQLNALTRTLDALASERDSDRFLEHVLRTIADQLDAHSCSIWQREESTGLVTFAFAFENGRLVTRSDARLATISPSLSVESVWPWPVVFGTGKPYVLDDIREGPGFPWREHVLALGVVTILIVPMLVAGRVDGVIGIRFTRKRVFRTEELDLAQALANQAMLAMQLTRLSVQSRLSAVIAERNRMARDIHDTLAQGFTGVIVQLEAAADATAQGLTREASDHLQRAGDLARESLNEARRSVRALRPQALEAMSLCEALTDLVQKMTAGSAMHAEFRLEGEPRPLPSDWEDNLLRVGQEVLTNALRHAHATKFDARLVFGSQQIRLELSDNGRGFDPSAKFDGFGLPGMRERVEGMGGQLTIESASARGTTVVILLPLASASQPSQA